MFESCRRRNFFQNSFSINENARITFTKSSIITFGSLMRVQIFNFS